MKKLLILFLSLLFVHNFALAEVQYNCAVPEGLSSSVARGITNELGMNLLTKKAAKVAIIRLLKKNAQGDYDVKIDSYSAMDLKKGKFKSVKIDAQDINAKGVYVSSAHLETICPYNHVDYWQHPAIFYTDVPMTFNAVITEDNLNKTLIDMGYIQKITDIKLGNLSFFKVDNVEFKLKHNKIYLITYMKAPVLMGEKTIKMTFSGKLNIEDGKIVLENLQSENLRNIDLSKFVDMINELNPFDLPLKVFKGTDTILSIKNIKILDNKIYINGIMVVKRSIYGQKEEEKK